MRLNAIRELSLSADAIKELRQKESKPILEELEAWLKEQIIYALPKSAIGSAMAYTLTSWPRLIRYVDDGHFNIDNNLIENSIRPVALGYVKLSINWARKIICSQARMKEPNALP